MEWWVWGLGLIVAVGAAIYILGGRKRPQYPDDLVAPRTRQQHGKIESRPVPTVQTRPAGQPAAKRSGGPKPDLAEILGYHPDYHFEQETLAVWITVKNSIIDPKSRRRLLLDAMTRKSDETAALRQVLKDLEDPKRRFDGM